MGSLYLFAEVDINSASKEELKTLSYIGDKKAQRIIDYREENCFDSKSELKNVKGIGDGIFQRISDDIIANGCIGLD